MAALALFVSRSDANPETIRLVAPGIWFREGDMEQGHSNNVIIEMKDYMIVVDANYPSGARAAMEDVKRVSKKPVKYVFDTHHHGDHLYGNALWTQAGATTLAFKEVGEEMKKFEPARWLAEAKTRPDVAALKRDAPEPPQQDINESLHVVNDGSRRVEFRYFGWAHTRGDGFVYLPKEQVLCTGDAVVNGPYNNTADAHIGNWPTVLHAIEKLKVKFVLPGHGVFGGRELITGQGQFFTELHKAVQDGISQGKKVEELQASIKLSGAVDEWVSEELLKRQIKDTFAEITAGKPRGELGQ
ncbi:MAG TPA: MBL fold metallo-hydrolase [Candidatus Sulfopaludibacter sp.]|jgi:glyoxylase-like metal-dependent hydrolase (beta-lactamase superfamily II)|nr:MBL fold metallo-hydrolase [Candidatus Sulfopaludibacter sp.]